MEPTPKSEIKRGKKYLAVMRKDSFVFTPANFQYITIISIRRKGLDICYETASIWNELPRHWQIYEIGSDFEKQYAINLQNFQFKEHIISLVKELEITEHNKPLFDMIAETLAKQKSDANSQL